MSTPKAFVGRLLNELSRKDARAAHLQARIQGKTITIGIEEGARWVPLLRLSAPSASFNVMNLDVRQGQGWAPTFERGTPAMLVGHLLDRFLFTWAPEVDAVLAWRQTSDLEH